MLFSTFILSYICLSISKSFFYRPELPLPELKYDPNQGDDFIAETTISTVYTFDPQSTLDFVVAKYSLDGKYLGTTDVRGGLLQLCKESVSRMNAAYTFGTYYKQSVNIFFTLTYLKFPIFFLMLSIA